MKERLVLVGIISIILIILAGLFLPKPDVYNLNRRRFWAYKTHNNIKQDIIIIGDSRAYRGISPTEMKSVLTDKRILNFGFSSGRLNDFMYQQAEKRLDEKSSQKIIVMAVSPNALTNHPDENSHINSQLFLPKEEIYQRIYFAPFLNFFSPIQPKDLQKKHQNKKRWYVEVFHDDGWVESYQQTEDTTSALKSYREWFEKVDVSADLVKDLIEQTEKWDNEDIMVFGYRPPSTYTMEELENTLGKFDENKFIADFRKAGGIWIETDLKDFHTYDGSHLHKDSARKLSRLVADEIKKHLESE